MTRDIAGICEQKISGTPVYVVEDGGVWISGMNANYGVYARRIKGALESCGYEVGELEDKHGGIFLSVPAAKEVEQ